MALAARAVGVRRFVMVVLLLGVIAAGGLLGASACAAPADRDPAMVLRGMAERSSAWLRPSDAIRSLEYDLVLGLDVTRIRVRPGDERPPGVWSGTTLQAGFQRLMRSPDRFVVKLGDGDAPGQMVLEVRPRVPGEFIAVEVGNGVQGSWRGYFTHGAPASRLVVDATRLVPLEETTGGTTIRYSEWREVAPGRWIPGQVDVLNQTTHFRSRFGWFGGAAWLLRESEGIGPEGARTLSLTRNVAVNEVADTPRETESDRRRRDGARVILSMLDHNRPWLDDGPAGAGWKPPSRSFSYTFRHVREDILERACLDSDGDAAAEVVRDPRNRMRGEAGSRKVVLKGGEYVISRRGARFGAFRDSPRDGRREELASPMRRYLRIGCQLDLPIFGYRERLDSAAISVRDGAWQGRPCKVANVSLSASGAVLGFGTMLAFSSWSYMHHIYPREEVLYIDAERQVPLHDSLRSEPDGKVYEIDFSDHIEVRPGQWAPGSIRIVRGDEFTAEYRFRLVGGTHWLLAEVVSWIKPEDRSRGVVEDVLLDDRRLLDDSLSQVQATRRLFGGEGQSERRVSLATIPFELGRPLKMDPYEVIVTVAGQNGVRVTAATADRSAADDVPVCFLGEGGRLLFAPSIRLQDAGKSRRGATTIRETAAWRLVRSVAIPSGVGGRNGLGATVVPLRWDGPMTVNIPGTAATGSPSAREPTVRGGHTRIYGATMERTPDGGAKLVLDLVSTDGPNESLLDLSAALVAESGEIASSGHLATRLRVGAAFEERRFEIPLGSLRAKAAPRFLLIGNAPGDVTSAPMGSFWASFMRTLPVFDVSTLLESPDEGARRAGINSLDRSDGPTRGLPRRLVSWEERAASDGKLRETLKPLASSLARIAREPGPGDLRADAARYLAYSEAGDAAETFRTLAADPDPRVRESVAVGLVRLGDAGGIEVLREILGRAQVDRVGDESIRERRLQDDAIQALGRERSDRAVDILGVTLLGDIKDSGVGGPGRPPIRSFDRSARARMIVSFLAGTGNLRAIRWLEAADDLLEGRPDVASKFPRRELFSAMLRLHPGVYDRASEGLESGVAAADWASAIQATRHTPEYLSALRVMFAREDISDAAVRPALSYLKHLGTPEAIELLREVYVRGRWKSDFRLRMSLSGTLAALGDGRGLTDAFDALAALERPAGPPGEKEDQKEMAEARERKAQAEAVLQQAPPRLLAGLLERKSNATRPAERRVVLRLAWRLFDLPPGLAVAVAAWARSDDPAVAEAARRLLGRG